MSVADRLAKALGGRWTYRVAAWHCDDGKRWVGRMSAGVDEFDNPLGPPEYWLYGEGTPRRVDEIVLVSPR